MKRLLSCSGYGTRARIRHTLDSPRSARFGTHDTAPHWSDCKFWVRSMSGGKLPRSHAHHDSGLPGSRQRHERWKKLFHLGLHYLFHYLLIAVKLQNVLNSFPSVAKIGVQLPAPEGSVRLCTNQTAFQTTGTPSNSKAGKDGWKSAVVLRQIRPLNYPICRPCGLHTCARCRFEDDNRRFPLPTCRAAYPYPNATYGSADHPQFNCTLVTRHGQSGILRQLALLRPAPFP